MVLLNFFFMFALQIYIAKAKIRVTFISNHKVSTKGSQKIRAKLSTFTLWWTRNINKSLFVNPTKSCRVYF
ncbi:hypothetical protein QG37_06267 [Candidozyma auris]|nr:hypothetical protein QG37_06267 [[Candida] auris]